MNEYEHSTPDVATDNEKAPRNPDKYTDESHIETTATKSIGAQGGATDSSSESRQTDNELTEIQKPDIKPVIFGGMDLNDVIINVLKAFQNISRERFHNRETLTAFLCGETSETVRKYDLDRIREFGSLREMGYNTMEVVIDWMIEQHLILETRERYPVLHSTYEGLHYPDYITSNKLRQLQTYLIENADPH